MALIPPRARAFQPRWLIAILVPAAVIAVFVAHLREHGPVVHDPLVLGLANFLCVTLASGAVVFLAGRSFLVEASLPMLMLTCGALTWAVDGSITLVMIKDVNEQMTLFNVCALVASGFHLIGAAAGLTTRRTFAQPGPWLGGGITAVAALIFALGFAAAHGWTPEFYFIGHGPTPIRDVVLGAAAAMFVATGALLLFRKPGTRFTEWYALALLLLATGLFGVLLQAAYDSPLSWTGRALQWLGGLAMLVAALEGAHETNIWGMAMEHALALARKKTADVLETVTEGFMAFDPSLRCTDANAVAAQLLSPRRSAVGAPLSAVFPELQAAAAVRAADAPDAAGRAIHREVFSPVLQRWFECHLYPNAEGIWVFFRDVTERWKAREEIRASEKRLRHALDASPSGYLICDAGQKLTYMNAAASRVLEAEGATVGRLVEEIWPAGFEAGPLLRRALETGATQAGELSIRGRAGGARAIVATFVPLSGESATVREVIGIFADVTQQKQTEQVLRDAVAERTATLQKAVEDLEHVSYAIAHDMRAPLRGMAGYAEVLLEDETATTAEQRRMFLERIRNAAHRMDKLISGALKYAKVTQQPLKLEPISTSVVLHGLVETYPNLHPDHSDVRLEEPLPVVLASEAALTQCLSNLLDNATKFVAPGVRPVVRVWAERVGAMARIWVEDNGIGIPAADTERVFEIYSRVSTAHEGTGVGLAVVRRLAREMGGAVGVTSAPGAGSRFWLDLKRPVDGV